MKYPWNDFGNAHRVLAKYGDRFKFVRDDTKGKFVAFDDRKWEWRGADTTLRAAVIDTFADMSDEALEYDGTRSTHSKGTEQPSERDKFLIWSRAQQSAGAVDACMRVLNGHTDMIMWPGDFDEHRHLINFDNGTLDTNTLQFFEHDPEDYITRVMAVAYKPDARCPRWCSFLEENVPDAATREYLQKVVGYTLTGRSNEKILMWLYGPANTGKSIIVNTLCKMFGDDYGLTANDGALRPRKGGGPSPELNSMKGKRYVAASETGQGQELDEALVKRITGGDTQNSRGLYANESNWNPECVIWVASNQFPQPRGDDDAIWGRFRPVEFSVPYGPDNPARDPCLSEKLSAELEGIAAWAVEGLRMYLEEGLTDLPHLMVMAADRFREEADPVRRFVTEAEDAGKLKLKPEGRCSRSDLFALYQGWCKANGQGTYSARRFYERLAMVPGITDVKKRSNGKDFVVGLELLTVSWQATPGWSGMQ
ncbi:phage/plasmid primase, P4 family [Streptomyces sp. NPDC050759]|uniref:DNA primase family protein n=1 Tax=Streptomyces sp. NPDC050759 TaxID=3365635 RepID=UPI0037A1F5BB